MGVANMKVVQVLVAMALPGLNDLGYHVHVAHLALLRLAVQCPTFHPFLIPWTGLHLLYSGGLTGHAPPHLAPS